MSRFCILTTYRSGSTFLVDLLDSHPAICALGEVFRPYPGPPADWKTRKQPPLFCTWRKSTHLVRPVSTWRFMSRYHDDFQDYEAVGFKLMYGQLARQPEILARLIVDGYRIVHLVRRNVLNIVLSMETMEQTRLGHSTTQMKETVRVRLDPADLLKRLRWQRTMQHAAEWMLRLLPNQSLTISYEALAERPQEMVGREAVQFILGRASRQPLNTPLKKTSKGSHRERIANYEEVKRLLRGTEFEALVE